MRRIATFLLPLLALLPQPLAAQVLPYDLDFAEVEPVSAPAETVSVETAQAEPERGGSERVVGPLPLQPAAGREIYGPFRILDQSSAAMVGVTDERTPAAFDAMLRDHPGIVRIEMVECPGTEDDRANLRLGRMIRARGIAMHVPADGWVASGAVDLFLAGTARSAEPSAQFAVHSWEDDTGRGPDDYSPDAPKNRAYIDYYRTMGLSERDARAFYAMTNSAPFSRPRELTAADITQWTRLQASPWTPAPRGAFAQGVPVSGGALAAAY